MLRKPLSLVLASFALVGFGASQSAAADTVHLKGGDHLSGTLVSK